MTSILGIGTSALTAFRRSLTTVGQNIANVNTPGYSRQTVSLSAREPQFNGVGFIGNGVQVVSIERSYNAFLDAQSRAAGSANARFSTLANFAGRIDDLLADSTSSLSSSLNAFFTELQNFATDPSSNATRVALVAETENLVQRYQAIDATLGQFALETRDAIEENVNDINLLAESIAELNVRIVQGGRDAPPNDLLDQRNQLIRDLAERVDVTAVDDPSGSISLFIGNGQTLVIGNEVYPLGVRPNEFDPTQNDVIYRGLEGDTPIGDLLRGGAIGALFEFENEILEPTRRALGTTAAALAAGLNGQNSQGLNADDVLGGNILAIGPSSAVASSANSGGAGVSVTVDDLSQVVDAEYRLINDGTGFRLFRSDTGEEFTLTGTGTAADPLRAAGISIEVSGTADAGDQFRIEPTIGAIGGLRSLVETGREFAAAGPLRAIADPGNLSDTTIDNGTVVDFSNPQLLATAVIEFTTPTTYTVDGAGSFTFTSGSPITVNGAEFNLTGDPTTGDRFVIEQNTNATADNRNALLLADTQNQGLLNNGETSIGQAYSAIVADVGSATRQANASADAQSVLLQSAETRRLEASGVDLDEEAADLIRFQQSFQAAAQVISVASTLFDTLLAATRR